MPRWLRALPRQRVVAVDTDIDDATADRVVARLLLLAERDPAADITVVIDSPGGSISAGLAILDTMRYGEPDVVTRAVGLAAGTTQLLLSAGAPGKRYALPRAQVVLMLPEPNREIAELIAADTGQPIPRVLRDAHRRRVFSAAEAVEYGLVDRVVRR